MVPLKTKMTHLRTDEDLSISFYQVNLFAIKINFVS